ncbi:hypothetical protein [Borrelia venezuelensis]|uniref:hypothetical protein n=1 Tax=Borrelia venezuelensis TaxID=1653839 RepID=UPI001FF2566E|nr:hypothetical protein [Borrelia venezuelensis]UPA12599.1 hypothetical protein bvRMA01_000930 [Borrelia venezuelensis]
MKYIIFVTLILISLISCKSSISKAEIDKKAHQIREAIKKEAEKKRKAQETINKALTTIPENKEIKKAKDARKKQLLKQILQFNNTDMRFYYKDPLP